MLWGRKHSMAVLLTIFQPSWGPKKKSKMGAHIDLDEKVIFRLGVLRTVHLLWTFWLQPGPQSGPQAAQMIRVRVTGVQVLYSSCKSEILPDLSAFCHIVFEHFCLNSFFFSTGAVPRSRCHVNSQESRRIAVAKSSLEDPSLFNF